MTIHTQMGTMAVEAGAVAGEAGAMAAETWLRFNACGDLALFYRRQVYNKVFCFNFQLYRRQGYNKFFYFNFGNMPRRMLDAVDIRPGEKGWTCIVQVIERHPVGYKELTTYPFQKRYRHYLLTDMKGTKIKAVMFDDDINFFERSLQPFKRYKISNAAVTLPRDQYQLDGYRFSWIITAKIPVEPVLDAKPYILPCTFETCSFADLHKFAETDANITIKALVVHQFPVVDISPTKCVKDYVVVNEEEIPIVLRLWKDLLADYDPNVDGFNKKPVTIIASNLEVKTFHGLSLATRPNTYIIENPPMPDNLCLNKWYGVNKHKVESWLKNKSYEDIKRFFPPPKPEHILDLLTAMTAFENAKTCWIKAKIRLSVTHNPLYNVVCGSCGMIVEAGFDWNVDCSKCGVLSAMEIKIKLPVTLNDENTNLRSTIKSPEAEKLIPFTATEIMKQQEEGHSITDDISIAMDNTEIVCFVKYYDKQVDGDAMLRRYVILKTYTLDEMEAFTTNQTLEKPASPLLQSSTPAVLAAEPTLFSPESSKATDPPSDFFTPTTKKILEEVTQECSHAESAASQSSSAKRSITFGTISPEDLGNVALEANDSETQNMVETPKKKNKGQEKNVEAA